MSISTTQEKSELPYCAATNRVQKKIEDQPLNSYLSSALQEMASSTKSLSEFISNIKKLLPMIPEQLNAVISVDILTLFLYTHYPANLELYSLLINHFSRIIEFLSDLRPESYQNLHLATHTMLNYILLLISSMSPQKLNAKELSVIFVCSELFTIIQKIPLVFVIMVVDRAEAMLRAAKGVCQLPSLFSLICGEKAPYLPEYVHKEFTLVLDLDETLGHFHKGVFQKRPGVDFFLLEMSKIYELVLFTASSQEYANQAMKLIDSESLILLRLYREHVYSQGVKDLELLGRDLDKVIIIDNFPKSFEKQPKNGIEIKAWLGDPDDQELMKLVLPLKEIPFVTGKHLHEMLEIINEKMKRLA